MKTLQRTEDYYKCEYCDRESESYQAMIGHEASHVRLKTLNVGQAVYLDSAYFPSSGSVAMIDIPKRRILVEFHDGERTWIKEGELTW